MGSPDFAFRFGAHQSVSAHAGETVALALLKAGIVSTSRSAKYRRPRGPFCLTGDCGTCLVRVDGQPNVRACLTLARSGLQVEPQNVVTGDGVDPTGVVDHALPGGMDHHHFMVHPRLVNRVMMEVARELTGLGTLPTRTPPDPVRHDHHSPQVLVVGFGPAGHAATRCLLAAGIDVLAVDRYDRSTLAAVIGEHPGNEVLSSTSVFGAYPAEAIWAAMGHGSESVIHTIRPRHVIVATGARASMPLWPNNDLPGIVSAQGLARQLAGRDLEGLSERIVVGQGERGHHWAKELKAPFLDQRQVHGFVGRHRVEGVQLSDGQRLSCSLVALAVEPAPAYELARQAGARVHWTGHGFAVVRDERGRFRANESQSSWACGDVCGGSTREAAIQDGERIANNLIHSLRGGASA